MDKISLTIFTHSSRRQISVAGEPCSNSPNYTGPMSTLARRIRSKPSYRLPREPPPPLPLRAW